MVTRAVDPVRMYVCMMVRGASCSWVVALDDVLLRRRLLGEIVGDGR